MEERVQQEHNISYHHNIKTVISSEKSKHIIRIYYANNSFPEKMLSSIFSYTHIIHDYEKINFQIKKHRNVHRLKIRIEFRLSPKLEIPFWELFLDIAVVSYLNIYDSYLLLIFKKSIERSERRRSSSYVNLFSVVMSCDMCVMCNYVVSDGSQ